MSLNAENWAFAKLAANCLADDTTALVESSSLLPATAPFKMKIKKLDSLNKIVQQEIVNVINVAWTVLTIERAAEKIPYSETATTHTQAPLDFHTWDILELVFTAQTWKDLDAKIDTKLDTATYDAEKVQKGTSATWTDSYQATISWVTSYVPWQRYQILCDVSNTSSATLEINALWAVPIKVWENGSLVDIPTNTITANTYAYFTYLTSNEFQFTSNEWNVNVVAVEATQKLMTYWEDITASDITNWYTALYVDSADWKVYKTDASNSSKINFIWFATEEWLADTQHLINTSWVSWWFSGLSIWDVYLQDWFITNTDNSNLVNSNPNNENQYCWYRIYVNNDCTLTEVKQAVYTNALNARLLNDAWTQLSNVSVSWWIATFNYNLIAWNYYRVEMYNNSASFTARKTSETFPINQTNINYVWWSYNWWNTTNAYNIEYINTTIPWVEWSIWNTYWANVIKVWKAISATEVEIDTFNNDNLNWTSSTTATAWWLTPPNITEYITIKVNWVDRKIAVYAV